ncbi:hypothetical protein TGDOM2_270080B, partial [Toxoplasma gondii GAB2-2007-GAL-DOM2]
DQEQWPASSFSSSVST